MALSLLFSPNGVPARVQLSSGIDRADHQLSPLAWRAAETPANTSSPLLVPFDARRSLADQRKKLSMKKTKNKKTGIFSRRRRRPRREGRRAHQRPRLRRAHRGYPVSRLRKDEKAFFPTLLFLPKGERGERPIAAAASSRVTPSLPFAFLCPWPPLKISIETRSDLEYRRAPPRQSATLSAVCMHNARHLRWLIAE